MEVSGERFGCLWGSALLIGWMMIACMGSLVCLQGCKGLPPYLCHLAFTLHYWGGISQRCDYVIAFPMIRIFALWERNVSLPATCSSVAPIRGFATYHVPSVRKYNKSEVQLTVSSKRVGVVFIWASPSLCLRALVRLLPRLCHVSLTLRHWKVTRRGYEYFARCDDVLTSLLYQEVRSLTILIFSSITYPSSLFFVCDIQTSSFPQEPSTISPPII